MALTNFALLLAAVCAVSPSVSGTIILERDSFPSTGLTLVDGGLEASASCTDEYIEVVQSPPPASEIDTNSTTAAAPPVLELVTQCDLTLEVVGAAILDSEDIHIVGWDNVFITGASSTGVSGSLQGAEPNSLSCTYGERLVVEGTTNLVEVSHVTFKDCTGAGTPLDYKWMRFGYSNRPRDYGDLGGDWRMFAVIGAGEFVADTIRMENVGSRMSQTHLLNIVEARLDWDVCGLQVAALYTDEMWLSFNLAGGLTRDEMVYALHEMHSYARGGSHAMSVEGVANIRLTNSVFVGNAGVLGSVYLETGGPMEKGDVLVESCTFEDNHANHEYIPTDWKNHICLPSISPAFGGALHVRVPHREAEDDDLTDAPKAVLVRDSTFRRNSAQTNGGAVFVHVVAMDTIDSPGDDVVDVTFDNCAFELNKAGPHYAEYCYDPHGGAVKVQFEPRDDPMAMCNEPGERDYLNANTHWTVNFIDSDFMENESSSFGGAVDIWKAQYVNLQNTNFDTNYAIYDKLEFAVYGRYGGAIYARHLPLGAVFDINESRFTGNRAVEGGGAIRIFNEADDMERFFPKKTKHLIKIKLRNSVFDGNIVSRGPGGGVFIKDQFSNMEISDCAFMNNRVLAKEWRRYRVNSLISARIPCGPMYSGGALAFSQGTTIGAASSTFMSNKACYGGAAIHYDDIHRLDIPKNINDYAGLEALITAAGAPLPPLGPSQMLSASFHTVWVQNKFSNNTSILDGGALCYFHTNPSAYTAGNTFNYNTAGERGGAISFMQMTPVHPNALLKQVVVQGSTFTGNVARESGGAIDYEGVSAVLRLMGSTFVGNSLSGGSSRFGGAVSHHSWSDVPWVEYCSAKHTTTDPKTNRDMMPMCEQGCSGDSLFPVAAHMFFSSAGTQTAHMLVDMEDCEFVDNSAGVGAGLAVIIGNRYRYVTLPGALERWSYRGDSNTHIRGTVEIRRSKFKGGYAENGGAVAIVTNADLTTTNMHLHKALLRDSVFEDNAALRQGGAVYIYNNPNFRREFLSHVELASSSFTGNYGIESSSEGGALYHNEGGHFAAYESHFANNSARLRGGALLLTSPTDTWENALDAAEAITLISDCSFSGNSVFANIGRGGAVAMEGRSQISVKDSVWTANVARDGGGLHILPADVAGLTESADFYDTTSEYLDALKLRWASTLLNYGGFYHDLDWSMLPPHIDTYKIKAPYAKLAPSDYVKPTITLDTSNLPDSAPSCAWWSEGNPRTGTVCGYLAWKHAPALELVRYDRTRCSVGVNNRRRSETNRVLSNRAIFDTNVWEGNTATIRGGALVVEQVPTIIYQDVFRANEAGFGGGGAIHTSVSPAMTLLDATFEANRVNVIEVEEATADDVLTDLEVACATLQTATTAGGRPASEGPGGAVFAQLVVGRYTSTGNATLDEYTSSTLLALRSAFHGNSANDGGAVEVAVVPLLPPRNGTAADGPEPDAFGIVALESEFRGNAAKHAGGALSVYTPSIDLALTGGLFDGNSARSQGGAVFLDSSVLGVSLENVALTNNAAPTGAGLYGSPTTIDAAGLTLSGNVGIPEAGTEDWGRGGALYLEAPLLAADETASSRRRMLSEHSDAQRWVHMTDCTLEHNDNYAGAGVHARNFDVVDVSNMVAANNTAKGPGGAVFCSNVPDVRVADSSFTSNSAGMGGGIQVMMMDQALPLHVEVAGTDLSGNSATRMTGAEVSKMLAAGTIEIRGPEFTADSNRMEPLNGNGGGLGVVKPQDTFDCSEVGIDCKSSLSLTDSNFVSNDAGNGGGMAYVAAIANGNLAISNVDLENNSAERTGGAFLTTVKGEDIKLTCPDSSGALVSVSMADAVGVCGWTAPPGEALYSGPPVSMIVRPSPLTPSVFFSYAEDYDLSFTPYVLDIVYIDAAGDVVESPELYMYKEVTLLPNPDVLVLEPTSVPLAKDRYQVDLHADTGMVIHTFETYNTQALLTFQSQVLSTTTTVLLAGCATGSAPILAVGCRTCAAGHMAIRNETDPIGTTRLCKVCSEDGDCRFGGSRTLPRNGFWHQHPLVNDMTPCPYEAACRFTAFHGNPFENVTEYDLHIRDNYEEPNAWLMYSEDGCSEGYTGLLCASCVKGLGKTSKNACSKCPDSGLVAFLVFFTAFFMLFVFIVMHIKNGLELKNYRGLHHEWLSRHRNASYVGTVAKLAINFLQMVSISKEFLDPSYPNEMQDVADASSTAASIDLTAFVSLGCADTEMSPATAAKLSVIFRVALAVLYPFMFVIVWLIRYVTKRNKQDVPDYRDGLATYLLRRTTMSAIMILWVVYQPVVQAFLSIYDCTEITKFVRDVEVGKSFNVDRADKYFVWSKETSVTCYESDHLLMITIMTPLTFLWCFGVPVLLYLKMSHLFKNCGISVRHKKNLLDMPLMGGGTPGLLSTVGDGDESDAGPANKGALSPDASSKLMKPGSFKPGAPSNDLMASGWVRWGSKKSSMVRQTSGNELGRQTSTATSGGLSLRGVPEAVAEASLPLSHDAAALLVEEADTDAFTPASTNLSDTSLFLQTPPEAVAESSREAIIQQEAAIQQEIAQRQQQIIQQQNGDGAGNAPPPQGVNAPQPPPPGKAVGPTAFPAGPRKAAPPPPEDIMERPPGEEEEELLEAAPGQQLKPKLGQKPVIYAKLIDHNGERCVVIEEPLLLATIPVSSIHDLSNYLFMFQSYRVSCPWWETVVLLRKLCMVIAAQLLVGLGTYIQVLGTLAVMATFMQIQTLVKPYWQPMPALLDLITHASAGMIFILGLCILSSNIKGGNVKVRMTEDMRSGIAIVCVILFIATLLLIVAAGINNLRRAQAHKIAMVRSMAQSAKRKAHTAILNKKLSKKASSANRAAAVAAALNSPAPNGAAGAPAPAGAGA